MSSFRIPTRSRLGRSMAFGLALGLLWAAVPRVPAIAAPTTYYLAGDGVPLASLTQTAPVESDQTRRAPWSAVGGSRTTADPSPPISPTYEPASDA